MTPERWRQVQWLFDGVLSRPLEDRSAYLAEACADDPGLRVEVDSLIRSLEEASHFLDAPVALGPEDLGKDDDPEQIGAYRILRSLGSGGVGQVYLAERAGADYRQAVAVKLLKRGMDTDEIVRRFRGERQILAQLEHANIARLLDGGSTEDGRPFLVMEHVDGVRIDRYCDEHQLTTRQRLRLFRKVCDAVHFAHRNLVVHRDLKPSNILVSPDGEPKLLDFGIAKLLRPDDFPHTVLPTAPGLRAMTPEYASPEQVLGGPITTATDVYSLGIVLYELLTGSRPYALRSRRAEDVERAVCRSDPDRPSSKVAATIEVVAPDGTESRRTPESISRVRDGDPRRLRRALRGDLDNIVLRALQKEPERRYRSVEQLSSDLAAHLAGLPVSARPATVLYRASKFVRRHRLGVAFGVALFGALTAFSATLWIQRERILEERVRAEQVSDFLVRIFRIPDPTRTRGENVSARELLDQAAREIERELQGQPRVRGLLLGTMGQSYLQLGLYEEAESLLERSLEAQEAVYGARHAEVASALQALAHTLMLQGDYARAEALNRRALEQRRQLLGEKHPLVAESLFRLARIEDRRGAYEAATTTYQQALEAARAGSPRVTTAEILGRYAGLLRRRGSFDEARQHFEEALGIYREAYGERHPDVAQAMNDLALLDQETDPDRAGELLQQASAIQRQLFGEAHPQLAITLSNLALVHRRRDDLEGAETLYLQALEMQRRVYEGSHPNLATTLNNLADLRVAQGRSDEAEDLYRQALAILRRELGEGHAETANALNNLAGALAKAGRHDEAEPLYRRALAVTRRALGESHYQVGTILANLAGVVKQTEPSAAEALYREALDILRSTLGEGHPRVAVALHNLASLQRRLGKLEEAAVSYEAALDLAHRRHGPGHSDAARIATSLAAVKVELEAYDEAEALARAAVETFSEALPADSPWRLAAERILGIALLEEGRLQEAEGILIDIFERVRRDRGLGAALARGDVQRLVRLYDELGDAARAATFRAMINENEGHGPC